MLRSFMTSSNAMSGPGVRKENAQRQPIWGWFLSHESRYNGGIVVEYPSATCNVTAVPVYERSTSSLTIAEYWALSHITDEPQSSPSTHTHDGLGRAASTWRSEIWVSRAARKS